ncbi:MULTISPECIES: TonB-dependent siderophore receptor [unclassified Janthinobacterium]|uniref:TonB-dependent receptor family protein n=1 Tax=unclassified Janthinobacterium TaxID=2610881 RepID=UPI00181506CA|nr:MULTISPECIES: TonB-dependent siderophore receptor [unclassified Janthinobacterium]MBB5370869.1 Fe(3+) dicitrate transport protein [Janthinobacterium sp. K2C7]MBB5383675.1 Fe(3+) dicitrate transport protein [Janthinobacterium sp. K2Li3]MBB5388180.1 Fe(3+) dicitrate transport protein [Janthinobacterium sp. K2E3]
MAAAPYTIPLTLRPAALAIALACLAMPYAAQAEDASNSNIGADTTAAAAVADNTAAPGSSADNAGPVLEAIQVSSNLLGTTMSASTKNFAGARTVVQKDAIQNSGATSVSDVMRRIPGVQISDNSGSSGSAVSLNIGVRGLAGRYSPRSTVLLDGIPMAVAPYGQPQLSFAPVSLANIETVDVVRGGGAVRFGPQNVGGIINFKTRAIPNTPGITGDASVRYNSYSETGQNQQYSVFAGGQLDNGLGLALLYSGVRGSDWRVGSDEKVNDFAIKYHYDLSPTSEIYGKLSYYDVNSRTPGGLTVAQYKADPYQNTRPTDFWSGDRTAFDIGYLNSISATQEFEIRSYYNNSSRQSTLINGLNLGHQPRNYETIAIEPRYTQRFTTGKVSQDVTVGYRYLRERADETVYNTVLATNAQLAPTAFANNSTDAQSLYIDDKIAIDSWRITPGVRYEHIKTVRVNHIPTDQEIALLNNKALPSINVAYLLNSNVTLFTDYNSSFGAVQNTQLNSQSANNPLQPELAKTAELGARWKSAQLSAEATLFNIKFDNQIQSVGSGINTIFFNIGATHHRGLETAVDYHFDDHGPLAGWNTYATYTYTKATLQDGVNAGNDVSFYSRNTDTLGAHYQQGAWGFDLSTTHQSRQFADEANTVLENAAGNLGIIPGYRTWNTQVKWKVPGQKGLELVAGANNLTNKSYFTRTSDSNLGKMVGAPRMVYLQGRLAF